MLEAAVRKGITEGVSTIAAQVAWHARSSVAIPPLDFPKWSLEEAAQGVLPAQAPPDEAPAAPEGLDAMPPEQRAEVEAAWEAAKAAADARWRKRVAAATLLQRRMPALFVRK